MGMGMYVHAADTRLLSLIRCSPRMRLFFHQAS